MTVSLSTVHIVVDDPNAALGFYRDMFGLTVSNEVAYEGFRDAAVPDSAGNMLRIEQG